PALQRDALASQHPRLRLPGRHHLHAARPGLQLQGSAGQNHRTTCERLFERLDRKEHAFGCPHNGRLDLSPSRQSGLSTVLRRARKKPVRSLPLEKGGHPFLWFPCRSPSRVVPLLPATPDRLPSGAAGIGGHIEFEDLSRQEYHCIELRQNMSAEIRKRFPAVTVTT